MVDSAPLGITQDKPMVDSAPLSARQTWFIQQVVLNPSIKLKELAEYFNISICTAKKEVARLKVQNILRLIGGRKHGHYELINKED